MFGLYSVQLLTGLVQGIVAITTAAFSCRVACCGAKSTQGTVVFSNMVNAEQTTAVPLTVMPTINDEKPPEYEAATNNPEDGDQYQRFQ